MRPRQNTVRLARDELDLMNNLARQRYALADGDTTRRVVSVLKNAGANVYRGYNQDKKVFLALDRKIKVTPRSKTFDGFLCDLEL